MTEEHCISLKEKEISTFKPVEESIEQLTKQVAKGGIIAFGGNVIGKVFGLALNIMLGRMLGAGGYGLYALGMSVMGIVQSVASLGLSSGVVRFSAMYHGEGDKARIKGTILAALGISIISSIVVSLILFVCANMIASRLFDKPQLTWILKIFALAIPFAVITGIAGAFAQSFRRIEYQIIVGSIFRPFVNLILVSLFFYLGFRLAGVVYGVLISVVLSSGLSFFYLLKIFPEIHFRLQPIIQIRKLLRYSLPMFLASFGYIALTQTDRIMLGGLTHARDVGIYNAAAVIALQIPFILSAFNIMFSPIISNSYNKGKMSQLNELCKIITKWTFSLSLPIWLVVLFFSKEILMAVYGSEFQNGWLALVILASAQMINAGTGPIGNVLNMTGKQDVALGLTMAVFVLNVGLNFWFIDLYGFTGAALASLISITLVFLITIVVVKKLLNIFMYDMRFLKPLWAGAAAFSFGLLLKMLDRKFVMAEKFWLFELLGVVLFYFILLYCQGLEVEDRLIMKTITLRIRQP